MKRIDFENGTVTRNIFSAAIPMLVAQILSLLYNIVDRIYIARIPEVGTTALGAVGLCFPLIVIITAFANLFGSGGAPVFSINRGMKDNQKAQEVMNTSFTMVCGSGIILMITGMLFARPLLVLFGASEDALVYAYPYMMIYLIGTVPSMIATGMNPFINAQGYATTGMLSVAIGAVANLILDPLFIFVLGFGIKGAAIATVLSQFLSAAYVLLFLEKRAEMKARLLKKTELKSCKENAKNIVSLGTAGFIMQLTNSLVTICCNNVLGVTGGDVYISVMTIVSSVRQMVETPIYAINEGTSPILSYNYGAKRPKLVRKAMVTLAVMVLVYTAVMWNVIIFVPDYLIAIFSSDKLLIKDAVPALKTYFAAFIFMDLQYIGQTVFKSLNKKKQAIFFSLLRKVFIVVPLTYLPYQPPEGSFEGCYYDPKAYMAKTIQLFERLRETYGWELELCHDVHERLRPSDAVIFAKDMEKFRLFFLEDCLSPEQSGWFKQIRQHCTTPLAMGELFNNPNEWLNLITEREIDYIRIHLSQIGGITPARKLIALCDAFGIRTAWHGPIDLTPIGHAVNIHLDMASPNFGIQEWADTNTLSEDAGAIALHQIFTGIPEMRDGYLYLNGKPGIGVDIDEKAAAEYPCSEEVVTWDWMLPRLPDGTAVRP